MSTDAVAQERAPSLPFPLQENERVLMVVRKHWVHLWPRTVFYALLAVVPVVALGWVWAQVADLNVVYWIIAVVWLAFWLFRILLNYYQYHNDIWVITNQRIIDSLKTTPFNLRIATTDLVNVQDMSVERIGVLRTLLNYGDIVCETASERGNFRLVGIPHPQEVQLFVDKERDRERMRAGRG